MDRARIALSGDFRKADGTPTFPSFDLGPLRDDPRVELVWAEPVEGVIPAEALTGCRALILLGARFTAQSVPGDGRLALVARFGVGYDNVDLEACAAAAIAVVITPEGVRRPVAVTIVTFVLALSQRLLVKDRLCRQGPPGWAQRTRYMGEGLVGRTFGQLGLGNIGAEACRLLAPFGLRLIAHDPHVAPEAAAALGVELVSEEALFRRADYLSIGIPLSPATRHFVNAARLRLMKPGAFLINTARGGVVDQRALHAALTEGRLAGAALDVFDEEPCPAEEPLLALENVVVTPHSLCWTDQCFAGIGAADVRAVLDLLEGRVPAGIVDRAVIDDPRWRSKLG